MNGSLLHDNDVGFQIVCTNCGCLSIKIEEPLTATREAIVYCGDCGTSRGTVGSLRDLSVSAAFRHRAFEPPDEVSLNRTHSE